MSIEIPTNSHEITEGIGDAVEKFGKNDRNLMISIVIVFIAFLGFVLFYFFSAINKQREDFIHHIEQRDQRNFASMDKMSDALDKNSQAMAELQGAIKAVTK